MNSIDDYKSRLSTIRLFADNILFDINRVKRSTTKDKMLAYIDSWKTELENIKFITRVDE